MKLSKSVNPTGSYTIVLPADVCEDKDDRVMSYWLQGREVLLQLSSYARLEDKQVSANDRLKSRLAKENLFNVKAENIAIPSCPDCAAMSGIDEEGNCWIFCYAVWLDLTILITISGSAKELATYGEWAYAALNSISRA